MDQIDTPRHAGLRHKLVALMMDKGIKDPLVLRAIANVPRHFFLDSALDTLAYMDRAVPIGAGQTISQPYTVSRQSELLCAKPGHKVLEIGTGSGYQAAVLCEMGVQLCSIERQEELYHATKQILLYMGYTPQLVFGDGFQGLPQEAPFDRIIVTCGAATMPDTLLDQLVVGGRIVIPLGPEGQQQMYTLDKIDDKTFTQTGYGDCSFVPMLGGVNR